MHISFSPIRHDEPLILSRSGDTIIVNDDVIDLSALPDGATLPASAIGNAFISGDVRRIDGMLHITLLLPHGPDPSAKVAFPADLIDPPDGRLMLPNETTEA